MRSVALRSAVTLSALALLWAIPVRASPRFGVCGFHWLTGKSCPLCGLTRGMFALAKGSWSQAIQFNALTPLAAVMLLSLLWSGPWRAPLWKSGMAAFAIYGFARLIS